MNQKLPIRKNTEHPADALWWKPVFTMQKEMNRLAQEMTPEFVSGTFWKAENENISMWHENMHRLFCEMFNTRQMITPWLTGGHTKPYIDIKDTGESFVIKADVPGLDAENFDISYADSAITIGGYTSTPCKNGEYLLHEECCDGSFCRTVALPDTADTAKAVATLDKNVLTIEVPRKQARLKTRKLNVSVANDKGKAASHSAVKAA